VKTNTVVIVSVVAMAGIAFYVASRPPVTNTRIVETQAELSNAQKVVGGLEAAWESLVT
jgi:hypothetical protein